MSIVVHLPTENRTVAITDCSTLNELSNHPSASLQKLAFSHLFFQRILAYGEVLIRGDASPEEISAHLEEFAEAYNTNSLDFETDSNDPIGDKIAKMLEDKEFEEKYDIFLRAISGEIFKLFASGAIAYEEGDMELSTLPAYMKTSVPTQA